MVTKRFNSSAGSQEVEYTIGDNCTVNFSVSSDATNWLSWEPVSGSKKIKVTVKANSSTSQRTGYIIANVNGSSCNGDKRLEVVQDGGSTPPPTPTTCECSAFKFYDFDSGQEITSTFNFSATDTEKKLKFGKEGCTLTDVGAQINGSPLYFETPPVVSTPENGFVTITIKRNSTEVTSTVGDGLVVTGKSGSNSCEKSLSLVINGGSQARTVISFEEDTNLLSGGQVRRLAARVTTDDPDFDVNELSINTPEWITTDVEQVSPSASEYNVYFTYGYTPISRSATVGASYRSSSVEGGQKEFPQEGDPYQTGLAFAITKTEPLNACGGIEDKIGEYYYGDNFGYVQNTSFTCTTKPNWVTSVTFGIPDTSTKKGEIYATYARNPGNTTRPWEGITITYSGYQDVMPRGETSMSQSVVTASVGACGDSENPGTAPNSCSEANFYHYDNPYVPGDLSYYYLEHNLTAYEQDYTLRTAADFCQYEIVPYTVNGVTYERKVPVSTISIDEVWKDVRVEIYDVVPDIVHNSACGLHHVEVHKGDTFALVKERHTSGNSKSTCACNCWFDGWNPNNGAYEIYGTKETALIAVYENGNLKTSETDEEAYSNFWLKATDCSHTYSNANGWRELNFTVERNTGAGAYDRCAVIKVYPKINGVYCTADCQDCERTARCQNERNCCLTDMVVQESVNCANPEEYFDPNHAYFNKYITSKWGETLTNQMIYNYWWGPCNDTEPYINAVDVYDALVTVTYDGNVRHTQTVGEYLGTVCAAGVTPSSDRTTFTSDDCISSISITSEYDSDSELYRGWIRVSTNAYSPEGIGEYDDDRRYRTRILVPYHSGVNYEGWPFISEVEGTNRGEEYYTYYGPKRLNQICYGQNCTPSYDGIDNGAFCVIEQDGFKTNS